MSAPSNDVWLPQRLPGCGAVRLCDLDGETTLPVACEPCGRRGRYRVETLAQTYGPRAGLPDVRWALAQQGECRGSMQPLRPCSAVFEREGG